MKKLKLMLYAPGLVIFDPLTLTNYLEKNNIIENDLLKFFSENEKIGREVISKGCIIPIYEIPELDDYYRIIINPEKENIAILKENLIFTSIPFLLHVTSGNIIISDISSIMNWDKDYYLNYENLKDESYDNCDSVQLSKNNYSVKITGYCGNNLKSNTEFGYIFYFRTTQILPHFDFTKSIDEYNFVVDPENRRT